jgi:AraC family transcriptional regulator, transcriptional activator of pobA
MQPLSDARPFQLYGDEGGLYVPDLVHLETIAARASLHNWLIGAHRHPTILQLLYIEEGRGAVSCAEGEFKLDPPALVLSPCDCPHAFRFAPDARGWVLSVAEALLHDPRMLISDKPLFLQRNAITRIPVASPEQRRLIPALFGEIERRRRDANIDVTDGLMATLSLLFSVAQEISSAAVEREIGPASPRGVLFRRFMQLVEEQFRSGWTIGDHAAALGCSEATLTRACREVAHRPPGALVNERRLLEARRSLSLTTASVKQIASDLGYDDPAYFARSFRRQMGMTASEFRAGTMRPAPELNADWR